MIQKDLKYFFAERFQELLSLNSIDSYRVRCNNVFSLIRELRDVIDNWLSGYVKQFDTVCICIEESLVAIKEDTILDYSFYDKQLMIDDLTSLYKAQKGRDELATHTIYLLDKCISSNKDSYLDKIYYAISEILNSDEVVNEAQFFPLAKTLSKLAGDLACELLNERFSLWHLYTESVNLLRNIDQFQSEFADFQVRHSHLVSLHEYDVVLKMNGGRNKRLVSLPGFSYDSPEGLVSPEIRNDIINKFLASRGVLFYKTHLAAHDSAMAITLAVEQMESVIDKAMLGFNLLDAVIQHRAMTVLHLPDGGSVVQIRPVNDIDSFYADDERIVMKMIGKINQIQSNTNIANDVKDRLTSALRHLRIGNIETDTGQQLVNYWVALEFIFSSPKASDNTMSRLMKYLTNILMCCYANRRMSYLNHLLHKNGTLASDKDWWSLTEMDLNNLIASQPSHLTRYHLQEMKASILGNRDAIDGFLTSHYNNLTWQISRFYRYRNKLIHEAAILPGLENVIRCLRLYLVLLLNQLIGYFTESTESSLSMDSFFSEYTQKYNMLDGIIKKNHAGDARAQQLMNMVVYNDLVRPKV